MTPNEPRASVSLPAVLQALDLLRIEPAGAVLHVQLNRPSKPRILP